MAIFGNLLSKNTVFLDDFWSKLLQCAQCKHHGILFKSGALFAWIRYMIFSMDSWLFEILVEYGTPRIMASPLVLQNRPQDLCGCQK